MKMKITKKINKKTPSKISKGKALRGFIGFSCLLISLHACGSDEPAKKGEPGETNQPAKKGEPGETNQPVFTLPAQSTIPKISNAANSSITFQLTSNVAWGVAGNQSWCSVSPAKGSGTNAAVTITVKATLANPSLTSTRDCKLTFTATGVSPNPTRSVTQGVLRFTLPDQKAIQEISYSANSSITFQLTSNVAWSVAGNQSWCSVSPTKGSGTNAAVTITVKATLANPSRASTRDCTLTFTVTRVSPNPTRSVTQGVLRFDLPDQKAIQEISYSANSSITFQLTSNVAWSVTANPTSWCSVSPAKGKGTNTAVIITVTASAANTATSARNCTLTFTATGVAPNPARNITQLPLTYTNTVNSISFTMRYVPAKKSLVGASDAA